ncbi:MAG: hypothetical protein JW996_03815, partial [Candidatus Cloacimonetes bacterium]|nr:hypothetical protein [Candidatus Cloacimonadota bacterium]
LYLLTKHRSDSNTCLYRFDSFDPLIDNPVTKLGSYPIRGMVTAADTSEDGSRLVVLTYNAVWMFESDIDDYFEGKTSWLPISAKQCEGICFDNDTILISNEQTELFSIPVSDLILIKE